MATSLKKSDINGSINDIAIQLGYHSSQLHTYWKDFNDPKIHVVCLEIFTKNVVFILAQAGIDSLDEKYIDDYLKGFNLKEEYGGYKAKDLLENGIEYQSLKIDFLGRIFNIKEPNDNGLFFVESINMNLFFIDGRLTDIQPSDGLSEWARQWKDMNPRMFNQYEEVAKRFWGTNLSMIIKEINKQADAWAAIPNAMNNEFLELHTTKFGTINFYMLKICHYVKAINLEDFLEINHGRYKEVKPLFSFSATKNKKYIVDRFTYEFSLDGNLSQYYSKQ